MTSSNDLLFSLMTSQPALNLYGFRLERVMFRPKTLMLQVLFYLYPNLLLNPPTPIRVHLHGNPLEGQLLPPFAFSLLNSNHYFQRKACPISTVSTESAEAPVQHATNLLLFLTLLLFDCGEELHIGEEGKDHWYL